MTQHGHIDAGTMLQYMAGECGAEIEANIREQLKDPESSASLTLRDIDAIGRSALSDQMLSKTAQIVDAWFPAPQDYEAHRHEYQSPQREASIGTASENDSADMTSLHQDKVLSVAKGSMIGGAIGIGAAAAAAVGIAPIAVPVAALAGVGALLGGLASWCFSGKKPSGDAHRNPADEE